MNDLAVAVAVNDPSILELCLAASPDVINGTLSLDICEGFKTAGAAYNEAISNSDARWLILAHQDVYLPAGFARRVFDALTKLTIDQPDWAVAGLIGATQEKVIRGLVWCSGNQRIIGDGRNLPAKVDTIDELLIVIRRDSDLKFDELLPSFHLYGADIVLQAALSGHTTWIINAPVVHHSKPVVNLGGDYAKSYNYMRRKWSRYLPIFNLCCPITTSPFTRWYKDLRLRIKHRGKSIRTKPPGNPQEIAAGLGWED